MSNHLQSDDLLNSLLQAGPQASPRQILADSPPMRSGKTGGRGTELWHILSPELLGWI